MRRALLIALLLLAPVLAEEEAKDETARIRELVTRAMKALDEKDHETAGELLQKAAALCQKQGERDLSALFFAAPKDWERGKIEKNSGTWGTGDQTFRWTEVSTSYVRKSDGLTVDVRISSSPQIVQAHSGMLKMLQNPQYVQMMNQDPNRKLTPLKRESWQGLQTVEPTGANAWAVLNKLLVMFNVRKGDPKVIEHFLDAFPWADAAKAAR